MLCMSLVVARWSLDERNWRPLDAELEQGVEIDGVVRADVSVPSVASSVVEHA